jgi:DNA primase
VFNLDKQTQDKEFVIVVEGPMDALSIDAVAILGAEIMDKQALLINRLGRRVIVVPDRDADGKRTIEQAILNRYSVSMPTWPEGVKDVNDAVKKLGRLYTLYKIVSETDDSELKIRLKAKQWFLD